MMDAIEDVNDRLIAEYYHALPDDITITDAITTHWGPERNIATRRAVGMPWGNGETCMVNMGGVVQVTTPNRAASRRYAGTLTRGLPDSWTITVTRRPDGVHMVTAYG